MTIAGKPVVAVLLEEAIEIAARVLPGDHPRAQRQTAASDLLHAGRHGHRAGCAAATLPPCNGSPIDPLLGLRDFQVRVVSLLRLAWSSSTGRPWSARPQSLWLLYQGKDATLVEINPLCLTRQGSFVALDAKVSIDANAVYRHPEFASLREDGR